MDRVWIEIQASPLQRNRTTRCGTLSLDNSSNDKQMYNAFAMIGPVSIFAQNAPRTVAAEYPARDSRRNAANVRQACRCDRRLASPGQNGQIGLADGKFLLLGFLVRLVV
jgi:hypothetical protein